MVRRNREFSTAWVILILLTAPAFAQLPAARLTGIFPPGGRIGTRFDVTASGADLDGATELLFSRAGISARPSDQSVSGAERKFTVTIGPDVPVGECEVRFVGAYGISNPRAFAVGERPEVVRIPTGKLNEHAMLTVGSIVNARCTAETVDSYSVELKSGERMLFECATGELDSKMSPVMTLHDDAAHEVERSRHGGLLDFTPSRDGTYTLQVHDLLYRGGPDYFYRLTASVGPHLDAIFPPAGQPGSKAKYTLYGRNLRGGCKSDLRALDGKPLDQLEVEIELPAEGSSLRSLDATARAGSSGWAADVIAYRLQSDAGSSNPVLIGLTGLPLVAESKTDNDIAHAQKLQPPVDVVGRFYPHGNREWFTFDALKGNVFWIEMFSQQMGLPSKPVVLVQRVTRNDKGVEQVSDVQEISGSDVNPGGPAFRMATRDGTYRLEAEPGSYRLMVRDQFNTSVDNAALTYRLSIHKRQPDFHILVLPIATANNEVGLWSASLRQGGAFPMQLILARHDGFNGAVHVDVEGLPADLKCRGTTIPAGQNNGIMVLEAADHAAEWCGPVRIVGRANVNHEQVSREARIGAVIWPSIQNPPELAVSRLAEDFAVAVSGDEQEPISFDVDDKPYEVAVGGKLQIPVKIRRNLTVNGPVKITPAGLAALSTVKELTLAPDVKEGSLEIDPAQQKLGVGSYTFFLQAQGQVTYQRRSFPLPAKKDDVKKTPQALQATSYSPLLTVNVVARGTAKDK